MKFSLNALKKKNLFSTHFHDTFAVELMKTFCLTLGKTFKIDRSHDVNQRKMIFFFIQIPVFSFELATKYFSRAGFLSFFYFVLHEVTQSNRN